MKKKKATDMNGFPKNLKIVGHVFNNSIMIFLVPDNYNHLKFPID